MNESLTATEDTQVIHRVQVEIPWSSIGRLLVVTLLTYIGIVLLPILKALVLAILVAVALSPITNWVSRKGWPPWVGYLLASSALVALVVGCFAVVAPLLFHQMSTLGDSLPRLRQQIIGHLSASGPIRQALENTMSPATVADSRIMLQRTLVVVQTTLGGLIHFLVVLALAMYLLVDGPRSLQWLLRYIPVAQRAKISEALRQIYELSSAYFAGQALISIFCAVYLSVILEILGVPMALLLGVVAGICDILPVIGFFIAVFLAMAMGLTVSPGTALLVFVLYGAYHLFEDFYLIPRVYGKKLRLSRLAVPLAVAAGGLLAGVVGAIAVLPIVAAYPVIERMWLAPKLKFTTAKGQETV